MPRAVSVEPLEGRRLLAADAAVFAAHVDFAPATADPVSGYVADAGAMFADRGNGLSYGWDRAVAVKARRHTDQSPDARYDTFAIMGRRSVWNLAVPAGIYTVHVAAGDAKMPRCTFALDVEGTPLLRAKASKSQRWAEGTATVVVTDGMLTVTGDGKAKNRVDYIDIAPATDEEASLVQSGRPAVVDWHAGRPSPIPRSEAVGAAVNGKLYVLGGISGDGRNYHFPITARCDVYDPATDSWQRVADMPEPFTHSVAAVDGDVIWFAGNYVGNTPGPGSTHVWKYDTVADTWTRGPDLPEARGGGAAAIVGRELHYFGGRDKARKHDEPTHWALNLDDPSAGWVRKADLPNPRNHMAAATVGGKIYAVGGQTGEAANAVCQTEVDAYNPATDTWTRVADMPGPRSHINACTLAYSGDFGDRILVLGGESRPKPETIHREIFSYDPATDTWSTPATLPEPRGTAVAGIINGQLVLATGNALGSTSDVRIGTLV